MEYSGISSSRSIFIDSGNCNEKRKYRIAICETRGKWFENVERWDKKNEQQREEKKTGRDKRTDKRNKGHERGNKQSGSERKGSTKEQGMEGKRNRR